jgi:hypothetical protein
MLALPNLPSSAPKTTAATGLARCARCLMHIKQAVERSTYQWAELEEIRHAWSEENDIDPLKRSIASMTSLDPKHIEIQATNAVVSVRLVDTLYNSGPASDREYLASTIAALIEKDSKQNPSLAKVIALHVQFLKRGAWYAKTIDTVEFRRDQRGLLTRHRT